MPPDATMHGAPAEENDMGGLKPKAPTHGSGHSRCRKSRFAGTLASIYIGMALSGIAKDIYLEKLGAHPIAMGVCFFVVSLWAPLNEVLSSRLQERQALSRWFPVERWGRKAPWLLTHIVVLAVACGVLFVPPKNFVVVHIWFVAASVVIFWAMSTCLIAFESVRQEIYPYNEERAEVELYCKLGCTTGIGFAALPLLVLAAQSTFAIRAGASALFMVGVLIFGLQAWPVWLEAKSVNVSEEERRKSSLLNDIRETWQNIAFRHLCLVRLYDGLYQGIQATNMLYYLTYILQLHGVERSAWAVLVGLCNIVGDIGTAFVVGRAMRSRENSFRIQTWVMHLRVVDMVVTVLLLMIPMAMNGSGPFEPGSRSLTISRGFFLVWATFNRVCQSPFSFWRVGAQCWVVDEDIHHSSDGTRREAAFIGVASAAQNFARAVASAIAFLGYGLVGLQPLDCETECYGDGVADTCHDECSTRSILVQPETLRWYIRGLFLVAGVVVEVLIVYHTRAFPINGIRLAKLYNNQAFARGEKIDCGDAGEQMQKLGLDQMPSVQDLVVALPGKSKSLMEVDASAGVAHVNRIRCATATLRKRSRRGEEVSASVVFGPMLDSLRDERCMRPSDVLGGARLEKDVAEPPFTAVALAAEDDPFGPIRGRPGGDDAREHSTSPTPPFPVDMSRCWPYFGMLFGCRGSTSRVREVSAEASAP